VEYTETFKKKMIQRMLMPGAKSATELSKEVHVHQVTLSRWKREASTLAAMAASKPSTPAAPVTRTAQDKLRLVLEATKCSPGELGAFLRREGLHEAELGQWREAMTAALEGPRREAVTGKTAAQAKRIRELERELHRKDRALAETAALLVLQKKVRAIWGDEDDDTTDRNES
jgi:transposase